jgi:nitrogenase molybdenum-iron protein alpha/beta subunit
MDERVAIFGGSDALAKQLRVVARDSPKAVFVVTTCAAGIIGDDLQVAVETARDALPGDVPVIPVTADGDINGDYMQGVIDAMNAVADRYIDRSVAPEADMVNIVAEKNLATNTEANYRRVLSLLDALGLKVNCRFIRNCSVEQLTGFLRGRVNLLAAADLCGRTIRDYLHHRYGAAFLPAAFPVGCTATAQWLRELAAFFGKEAEAEVLIEREQERYVETLDRYRPSLKGKRVFIVTQSYQIDWVLDLVFDLGMEIVKVGVLSSAWDETS